MSGTIEGAEVTAGLVRQLDRDRRLALKLKLPAAAVSATMGKAKVLGLIRENREHSGPNGEAIKHDLSGLSDTELAQLESILTANPRGRKGAAGGSLERLASPVL